ncbi:GNAT family N-acetyltransferase [Pseudonocardiaceae bacterium YIM PH 21723]|nr:GNAT family N-acetyltransferase [Pseudonocardiaceae bacterium YIM PH 21723]
MGLCAEAVAELGRRYQGEGDTSPIEPGEFNPPNGLFLVSYVDGQAAGCVGWRRLRDGVAEMKRLYVRDRFRGLGLARKLLSELETRVLGSGCHRIQLETGTEQPESMRLYESCGYEAIEPYGYYKDSPLSRCFAKDLRVITPVGYDHPDAVALCVDAVAELDRRYGGDGDGTPMSAADFAPPSGLFLLAYLGGAAVACVGWRHKGEGVVEMKRMFVRDAARGKGLAKALLNELESTALAAGHRRVILETGAKQPESMRLYAASGYEPIANFGYYKDDALTRSFGKDLTDQ